jgi:fructokinase
MKIISIGEILWDVFEHTEHLGGAPFNFAAHACRLGHQVLFLSAVGDDERGRRALAAAGELGLSTRFIRSIGDAATGVVSVHLDAAGQPAYKIHRPAAYDHLRLEEPDYECLSQFEPDWIYFGTLHQTNPRVRELIRTVIELIPRARRFYDINLRRDSYTPSLVEELLGLAHTVKLNEDEAATVGSFLGASHRATEDFCRFCADRFHLDAICVTRGEKGCSILSGNQYAEVDGYPVQVRDTVGSGDAFAAAFLHGLGNGWPPEKTGDFANRVGALVAGRDGAIPPWTVEECEALARPAQAK